MMLKYEEGDELSAYSDGEILEPSKRKNFMGILATITKVLAGSLFIKSVTVTGNPTYVYDQYLVTATSAGYDLKYNNTLPSANNDRARPIREF